MIEVNEVWKRYGKPPAEVTALRGVTLRVAAGEFVAIMGPSGCGKSTLLHVLGGLDSVDGGGVELAGKQLRGMGERELTELRRKEVGIVFQFFNLLPTLTVLENVQLPALLQGVGAREAEQRAGALLEEVGLQERARHFTQELSGGEMQRTAVARALIMRPPVLLADEPTGNLDSVSSDRVVGLLRELGKRHGTTVVMVTHSRQVAGCADRIVEMRDGQVVSEQRVERVSNDGLAVSQA